jgi:hypothetical protein
VRQAVQGGEFTIRHRVSEVGALRSSLGWGIWRRWIGWWGAALNWEAGDLGVDFVGGSAVPGGATQVELIGGGRSSVDSGDGRNVVAGRDLHGGAVCRRDASVDRWLRWPGLVRCGAVWAEVSKWFTTKGDTMTSRYGGGASGDSVADRGRNERGEG